MAKPQLVLATGNRKKGIELAQLFGPIGLEVSTLADFDSTADYRRRRRYLRRQRGDQSDRASRTSGPMGPRRRQRPRRRRIGRPPPASTVPDSPAKNADDESNNTKLLESLGDLPIAKRTAHYVCHMTLSDPDGNIRAESEAFCRGRILFERKGTHGFGYDPLFEIIEYHHTFGELGPNSKAMLSHRARAARRILPSLIRNSSTPEPGVLSAN